MKDYVSIIVPIYNAEKTLARCLTSIINQTYKKIELILVNDGSTDSSRTICDKYRDNQSVVVIDKINGGVSSARNVGLDCATGEYILFVDSDDYLEKNMLEMILPNLKGADIVFSGYYKEFTERSTEVLADGYLSNRLYEAGAKMRELFLLNYISPP